jgi:hypothetical protein
VTVVAIFFFPKLTFWKIQSCGNVLETSNLINSTLDSLLDGGSDEAKIRKLIISSTIELFKVLKSYFSDV